MVNWDVAEWAWCIAPTTPFWTGEVDALAERGRAESDPGTRHSLYRQIEEIIARDALLIPLFHEQVYRFAQPNLDGLTVSFGAPTVDYANLRVRD